MRQIIVLYIEQSEETPYLMPLIKIKTYSHVTSVFFKKPKILIECDHCSWLLPNSMCLFSLLNDLLEHLDILLG